MTSEPARQVEYETVAEDEHPAGVHQVQADASAAEPHEHVCRICGDPMINEEQLVRTRAETVSAVQPARIGTSATGDKRRITYDPLQAPAETISLSERRLRTRTRRRVWAVVVPVAAAVIGASVYFGASQSKSPEQTFVEAAYVHLLARKPASSETAFWTNKMTKGASRVEVATGIVDSPEFRDDLISSYYKAFLGHPASPAAYAFWGAQLAGGASDQAVQEGILGSAEFYSLSGGTPAGFVENLYGKLLGRSPTTSEVASAEAQMSSATTQTAIATGVIGSKEYRSDFIDSYYEYMTGRRPSKAELDHWLSLMSSGAPAQSVVAGIVGSSQFGTS